MNREVLIDNLRDDPCRYRRVSIGEKLWTFVVRDAKIWWTYKMWILLDLLSTFAFVISYALVSLLVPQDQLVASGYARGGYFAFSVIGIAFQQYVSSSVLGISEAIRDEQWFGTMETILSSATSFSVFLIGESTFRFMISTVLLFGALGLGTALGASLQISPAIIGSVGLLSILMVFSHLAIGIASAGVIMKIKQGNPVAWAFSWVTQLVSGVFYPLNILPSYLKWLGRAFPLTYSLHGVRLCLMGGRTIADPAVAQTVLWLGIFITISMPLSLYIFKVGYDSSRQDGSLGQY